MMRRRVVLSALDPSLRPDALGVLASACDEVLQSKFPAEAGYLQDRPSQFFFAPEGLIPVRWYLRRGRLWGFQVEIQPSDPALTALTVTADSRIPLIDDTSRSLSRVDHISVPGRVVLNHILLPILIFPVIVLMPLLLLYQGVKALFGSASRRFIRDIEERWQQAHSLLPARIPMIRVWAPATKCLIGLGLGLAAIAACVWLAHAYSQYETWFYLVVVFLSLFSLVCLIGFLMSAMGFEVSLTR